MDNKLPDALRHIESEAIKIGFKMSCSVIFGRLLRTLSASKPKGTLLEIGTGVGAGTSWMLDGMDRSSRLCSIDIDPNVMAVARKHLSSDQRLTLLDGDATHYLAQAPSDSVDLLFADFRPGKFENRDDAIRILKNGGIYIVDDLLPQPTWPEDHQGRVDQFLSEIFVEPRLSVVHMPWDSGIIIATKRDS
ncbi:O-methyltransferase [Lacipirellula sp.]|uniref:O-methyltransferase n=1 Tax=Lacipirellula sp. TaxID=2691419 RepID=UPI003D0963B6